jgi:cysteine-rich repeat protein
MTFESSNSTCEHCNATIGYQTSEDFQCVPECGDGVLIDPEVCDDGNSFEGDGCSEICEVEEGFNANGEEIVPPEYKVAGISSDNSKVTILFSESVVQIELLSVDDFKVEIQGQETSYSFTWALDGLPSIGEPFLQFDILVSNLVTNLNGNELFYVQITSVEKVQDIVGNTLVDKPGSIQMNQVQVQSEEEQSTSQTSGNIITYLFLIIFAFTFTFNMIFESSMKYFWGISHLLQILRIIVLVNITVPELVRVICGYFKIAVGDLDIIHNYLPAFLRVTIINEDDLDSNSSLFQDSFSEYYDLDSPYLILEFEKTFFYTSALMLFTMPALFLMTLICRRIKFFKKQLQGFFYNAPLRTVTELYLDLCFLSFINISSLAY